MTHPVTMDQALQPTPDPAWVLSVDGYDSLRERSVESRFAISNGFLGIRGARAATRGARWVVPAHTYVAGLFDSSGPGDSPDLVPAADWLKLRLLLDDAPLVRHPGDVSSHRMTLDMRRGAQLSEGILLEEDGVRLRLHTMRLVSLSERAVGLQVIHIVIEEGSVPLKLEASFEGTELGLVQDRIEQDLGLWHTQNSGKMLAMAVEAALQIDGKALPAIPLGTLQAAWRWTTCPGQVVTFQRIVAIQRSDNAGADPSAATRGTLDAASRMGWRGVLSAHQNAWTARWLCSGIHVDGDAAAQQALRFAVYHLNSAANPADDHVSIGARALTGSGYRGHVFWDTEIFLLPFYTMTWPEAARTLLMYRFHTLAGARAKAAAAGWRGAMYAWESADTGAEVCPDQVIGPDRKVIPILCGKQEQHISADVAYAVWQYWQATADDAFLCDAGGEIILETGRFWASRARREADGHCHIRGVIGPDEYHEDVDDSAFTNVMARWNIRRALDVAAILHARWPVRWAALAAQLQLDDAELKIWAEVADAMVGCLDPKTGLFEEFAGYFELERIDLTQYAGRSVPMDVVLGRTRTQKSQVLKQADVVALLALLPEEFKDGSDGANFDYYEPRCDHGSSLSPAMHGLVAARLGHTDMALRYLGQAAAIDLSDTHVGIDGGVHIAALGGNWMLTVFGFAGVTLRDDGLAIDPHLPSGWTRLAFPLQWRGRHLKFVIGQAIEVTLDGGAPMAIVVAGESHELRADRPLRVAIGSCRFIPDLPG
jgi:trehalose/maltose hydrolase-like predicted phosphorylase